MTRGAPPWVILAAAVLAAPAVSLAEAAGGDDAGRSSCHLASGTRHVIMIQFDNVHLRRDNPNVPSDLEQMPNLLNFLESQGTLLTNHHTPLISHTADDIITTLTGNYPTLLHLSAPADDYAHDGRVIVEALDESIAQREMRPSGSSRAYARQDRSSDLTADRGGL